MGKTDRFGNEGPEQIAHAARKSANCCGSHFAARAALRAVQQIQIRLLQGTLRREHQNRLAWHSLRKKVTHPFDACGRLPRPCRTRDEELGIEGRFNYLTLIQAQVRHEARVQ